MICPTCGELLGDKQYIYTTELKKICDEFGVDDTNLTRIDKDPKFIEKRKKLIEDLFKNMCCRVRAMTYIELVNLIKG
jgi:DNA-directed RNA polymerase subunit N (RpoN/RPB10)